MDFESSLQASLDRQLAGVPRNLADSIRYSLLAPGKRIRPRLLLASARMLGLSVEAATPAAIALEMIHCFTLIHDDLPCMDNSDTRRGRPANHKMHGESIALLAGDGLMAMAFDIFSRTPAEVPPVRVIAGLKRLVWASGPEGVIGGQAAECLLSRSSTIEQLRAMHAGKTGALFKAAILIPKDFAGITDESGAGQALIRFADALGFAFQVSDDIDDRDQDRAQGGGEFPPTSILAYWTEPEARRRASGELSEAAVGVRTHWQEASKNLLGISGEVIQSLGPLS